jgi:nucleoside-diphosphate-sugar epimerase
MRVFVTGATGFVGSAVVADLIGAGHSVLGLSRSDAGADQLAKAGADVLRGDLADIDSLRRGTEQSDGVIHCGFIHDFAKMAENSAIDRAAIAAMGAVLKGSARPLLATSGVAMIAPGRMASEDDPHPPINPQWPRASEAAAMELAQAGVNASVVRLSPSVHDAGDHGFVPILIGIARSKGVSAYVEEGANRWPGVHRLDAGSLYRLAIEKGARGANWHGVADEGVPTRQIAEAIGKRLGVPVNSIPRAEAMGHFGFLGGFFSMDIPASNAKTRRELGWNPAHKGLLADIDSTAYFPG